MPPSTSAICFPTHGLHHLANTLLPKSTMPLVQSGWQYVHNQDLLKIHTIIYWLIVMDTITFSKPKGIATKQRRLLYEGGHQTFVEYLRGGIYIVLSYISHVANGKQAAYI